MWANRILPPQKTNTQPEIQSEDSKLFRNQDGLHDLSLHIQRRSLT